MHPQPGSTYVLRTFLMVHVQEGAIGRHVYYLCCHCISMMNADTFY